MAQAIRFTSREQADMILSYGRCNESGAAAAIHYARRFPNRRGRHPTGQTIIDTYRRLSENGIRENHHNSGAPRRARNVFEDDVLQHFEEDPESTCRVAAMQLGTNHTLVDRILLLMTNIPSIFEKCKTFVSSILEILKHNFSYIF